MPLEFYQKPVYVYFHLFKKFKFSDNEIKWSSLLTVQDIDWIIENYKLYNRLEILEKKNILKKNVDKKKIFLLKKKQIGRNLEPNKSHFDIVSNLQITSLNVWKNKLKNYKQKKDSSKFLYNNKIMDKSYRNYYNRNTKRMSYNNSRINLVKSLSPKNVIKNIELNSNTLNFNKNNEDVGLIKKEMHKIKKMKIKDLKANIGTLDKNILRFKCIVLFGFDEGEEIFNDLIK